MTSKYDEADIEELADKLKFFFKMEKEKNEGRTYRPHKLLDDKKIWNRVAEVVLKLKADPEDYIHAQFLFSKTIVLANTLHGPVAQKRYTRYKFMHNITESKTVSVKDEELQEMLRDTIEDIRILCGSCDFSNEEVESKVLRMKLRYNPFILLLLNPSSKFLEELSEQAIEEMNKHPILVSAAKNLNMALTIDLINNYVK